MRTARANLAILDEQFTTTEVISGSGTAAGSNSKAVDRSGGDSRRMSTHTFIAINPQMTAEVLKNRRASVEVEYGPHFRALGLSPEQIAKFRDVEVELDQNSLDLSAAVYNQELDPKSASYQKLVREWNDSRLTKKAAILGDLMGPYLDRYRSDPVRAYARELAWTGLITGETITTAQIERAGDILAASCQRMRTDSYPGFIVLGSLNWQAANDQLKSFLLPRQIEIIRLAHESELLQNKIAGRTNLLTTQFKKQAGAK